MDDIVKFMPRLARLDAPGVLHHIILRGIERRKIFKDDQDRNNFLERLGDLLPATKTQCYAWALLPNHAHFLFQSGETGLSTLMRRLLTGYAVTFNRRHRRHGQLFQNRYKSIICQEDAYLKELVRYIHLNPLRAKIVANIYSLGRYEYCGHGVIIGMRERSWQNTEYVLSFFGRTVAEARKNYVSSMKARIDQGRRPELVGGGLIRSLGGWEAVKKMRLRGQDRIKGDERILGDGEFVMDILSEAGEKYERRYELKRLGYNLDTLERKVSKLYHIDIDDLYARGRQKRRVEARSVFCYWAVRELGFSGTSIAKRFGMSQPGVVYAVNKGEKIVKENKYSLLD